MRKLIAMLLVVVMTVLCLPGFSFAEETGDVVTIFHTNDIHAYVKAKDGGDLSIAQVATLHKNDPNSLLVDAGDFNLGGSNFGQMTNGQSVLECMEAAGYDLGILGNHEFDKGVANFEEVVKVISYPIISSNVSIKPGFEEVSPYLAKMKKNMIFEVNGHKIGFFSIDTPTLRGMVSPSTLDAGGVVVDTNVPAVAAAMVAELKKAGAEVIIAVDHCGFTRTEGEITDPTMYNSYHVALVEGVDAVIDAHDHIYRLADKAEDVNGTLVVSTGTALNFLGALKIDFSGEKPVITSEDVTAECAAAENDPATQAKLDEWQEKIDEIANQVAFKSEANFWGGNVKAWNAEDKTQTTAIARRGYTNAGQLIADVLQSLTEDWVAEYADGYGVDGLTKDTPVVTYFGGGSVRGSFPKGDVTLGQLQTAYSFSFGTDGGCNYVLVSPKTLWVLLEHGVNIFGNPDGDPQNAETGMLIANGGIHGRFPQIAGASYVYDLTKTRSTEAVTDADGVVHVPETIGERIQSITLDDGTVLDKNDDESRILLITSDYQQGGGDGYWMLGYAKDWDGFYTDTFYEMPMGEGWYLIDYVNEKLGGVIPADMYSLTSDRIKRVNDPYTGTSFDSKIGMFDDAGKPMAGVKVNVDVDGGKATEYTTDETGVFYIKGLANGAHEVHIVYADKVDKTWYLDNYCGLVNIFPLNEAKYYTVTWVDEDGTELQKDEKVLAGTTPEFTAEEPTKEGFFFVGWDPEVAEIEGDVTYTAVYGEMKWSDDSSTAELVYEITDKEGKPETVTVKAEVAVKINDDGTTTFTATATLEDGTKITDTKTIKYEFTEGADAEWTKGSGEDLKLVVKRSEFDKCTFEKFTTLMIDGTEVASTDYKAVAGSVDLTLSAEALEALKEGEHKLTVIFADGYVETTLTVAAPIPDTGVSYTFWYVTFAASLAVLSVVAAKRREN